MYILFEVCLLFLKLLTLLHPLQSKDKMKRGSRRGCFQLRHAIIGIDDEDDSTFTIRVESRIYHFQGCVTCCNVVWHAVTWHEVGCCDTVLEFDAAVLYLPWCNVIPSSRVTFLNISAPNFQLSSNNRHVKKAVYASFCYLWTSCWAPVSKNLHSFLPF